MQPARPIHWKLVDLERDDPGYRMAIETAARALLHGQLVAFPTETVYGLGASIQREDAVKAIFRVKGRPADNPLIVHVADIAAARKLCSHWPPAAERAARAFWPGPLTMILPKTAGVSDVVTAGLATVAIRVPAQRVAYDLVSVAGPVAAPSANRSGRPSPTRAEHVLADLGDDIAGVLDDGPCQVGVESTVVDLTTPRPMILRPGGLAREALEEILGPVDILPGALDDRSDPHSSAAAAATRSPGTRYRHYAPSTPLLVVTGSDPQRLLMELSRQVETLQAAGKRVGLLVADDFAAVLRAEAVVRLGSLDQPETAAARLFDGLRQLDRQPIDVIVAHTFASQGIGAAVNDRLLRASYKIVRGDAGEQ